MRQINLNKTSNLTTHYIKYMGGGSVYVVDGFLTHCIREAHSF